MTNIREEILKALPTTEKFLALNFHPLKKLYEKYGMDEVFAVIDNMKEEGEIYWHQIHYDYMVIKRTEKSIQTTANI